jgi:hypothetical protein
MYRLLIAIVIGLMFQFSATAAFAADCTIIYGGGVIDCSSTITPTPTSQTSAKNQTQTKGGLPVHKPTDAKKTPATGPETIGLIGLIPAAAAGFFLRKKTNKPV